MTPANIRRYAASDADATHALFLAAVHKGTARYYSAAERQAWAPPGPRPAGWLAGQTGFVATEGTRIIGFMTLWPTGDAKTGLIDMAFVSPDRMGQGIAAALYDAVLADAVAQGMTRLTADASFLARPFFTRQGWQMEAEQHNARAGQTLINFRMSCEIGGPLPSDHAIFAP